MRIQSNHKVLVRARFIFAFLAALSLTAWTPDYASSKYDDDQRNSRVTWTAACRISQYRYCPEQGPETRRSPILGEIMDARGSYWTGSAAVWLDVTLHGTQSWLTTFHEQIHYIQYINNVATDNPSKNLLCLVEREALDFTNQYAIELERPDLQRTVEVWRDIYNCGTKVDPKSFMGNSDV